MRPTACPQVIDHDIITTRMDASSGVAEEAQLAFTLRHPHIVATLKYCVKVRGRPACPVWVCMRIGLARPIRGKPKPSYFLLKMTVYMP